MISQRLAKISLILNGILTLACFGLLIYALMQKTLADRNAVEANMQRQVAIEQWEQAEVAKQKAEDALMKATLQMELAKRKYDSLKLKNQTKSK
jgi:hypothetical protein